MAESALQFVAHNIVTEFLDDPASEARECSEKFEVGGFQWCDTVGMQ
jgi:hypothetical protein